MNAVLRFSGNAKMDKVYGLVKDWVAFGRKIMLYCPHHGLVQALHVLCQINITCADRIAEIVCYQIDCDAVVDIGPLRVVVYFVGEDAYADHPAECCGKTVEFELLVQLAVLDVPARQFGQCIVNFSLCQFMSRTHGLCLRICLLCFGDASYSCLAQIG